MEMREEMGEEKKSGELIDMWTHMGPTIFFYFLCETDMGPMGRIAT